MKLVIVESPSKAKTIEKYLGSHYKVKASKGHVVDLPKSGLGVDVDKNFSIDYQVSKPLVVKELTQAIKPADEVLLALDPDREGEAIAWHIAKELKLISAGGKKLAKPFKRIVFNEITEEAVNQAIASPREIDMSLVNAQQARRVLDRLVGYKLSPLLWKKIRFGLSAGRVQSVALRLIVEREAERDKFVPEEYWDVSAAVSITKQGKPDIGIIRLEKDGGAEQAEEGSEAAVLQFKLLGLQNGEKVILAKESDVKKMLDKISDNEWRVISNELGQVRKNPDSPFSTSLLQQAGVNRLKMSASRVMRVAQELYEKGYITYMRTDSIHLSNQAIASVRKYIAKNYGDEYVPEKPPFYKSKAKVAQEAHEAIRPTNIAKSSSSLGITGEVARVYDLIWERTVASQMNPAVYDQQTIKLEVAGYVFQGTSRKVRFPGFLKVLPERDQKDNVLPVVEVGQEVFPEKINALQHFTQPPPRYSEASLIKELERLGIGRPSTYAPIMQTIQGRDYVEKLGAYFKPTDYGIVVTKLLTDHFGDIINVNFTADMENQLDDVANGDLDWQKMLASFYKPFASNLDKQEDAIARGDYTTLGKSDKDCPVCGKRMVVKLGKNGRFLSCSDFPKCKGILDIDGKSLADLEAKADTKEFLDMYMPAPVTDDGRKYLLRKGRFGEFWAHPDYPKVKDAKPLELTPAKRTEMFGEAPKTEDGREYLLKSGRFGPFWAHPDYPEVKDIIRIKKDGGAAKSSPRRRKSKGPRKKK
ncbi:MAG: type I DNA topoisomerase [Candidatus Doudnabacteria bacterium]|nr:type I DNA topoisomerase [Candidatus Doudnabacteria bacterium]